MLEGLLYWLSPARRRFMRRLAKPGIDAIRVRLAESGSRRAVQFISTLLGANADFIAYALSPAGPLADSWPTGWPPAPRTRRTWRRLWSSWMTW